MYVIIWPFKSSINYVRVLYIFSRFRLKVYNIYRYIAGRRGITTRDNVALFSYIIYTGLDGDVLDGRLQVQCLISILYM